MTSFPSSKTKKDVRLKAPEFKSSPHGVLGSSLGLFCQEAVVANIVNYSWGHLELTSNQAAALKWQKWFRSFSWAWTKVFWLVSDKRWSEAWGWVEHRPLSVLLIEIGKFKRRRRGTLETQIPNLLWLGMPKLLTSLFCGASFPLPSKTIHDISLFSYKIVQKSAVNPSRERRWLMFKFNL